MANLNSFEVEDGADGEIMRDNVTSGRTPVQRAAERSSGGDLMHGAPCRQCTQRQALIRHARMTHGRAGTDPQPGRSPDCPSRRQHQGQASKGRSYARARPSRASGGLCSSCRFGDRRPARAVREPKAARAVAAVQIRRGLCSGSPTSRTKAWGKLCRESFVGLRSAAPPQVE